MRPTKTGLIGLAVLLMTVVSGCALITPGKVMMHAGTWVAKEVVMKEFKSKPKDGTDEKAQPAQEYQSPTTQHEG